MTAPSKLWVPESTNKLRAKVTNVESGNPVEGATVEITIEYGTGSNKGQDVDTSSMNNPITWPLSLINTAGDKPGEYSAVVDSDFPINDGDLLRGKLVSTIGSNKRTAFIPIRGQYDQD